MDRRYIKEYAVRTGQPLGEVATKLGINQQWLSRVIGGARVSGTLALLIERWSNGEITSERVLSETEVVTDG